MAIEYPPGTPSWVDLSSPDLDASARFYGELFGWEAYSPGPAEQTGGYRIFQLDGVNVGGLGPLQEGNPPHWMTYVAVADADETKAKVEAAGGRTFVGVLDVMEAGRMAVFGDGADGAVFGIWEPGYNRGAQVVNRPGALSWNELDTRDRAGAERFYGEVFGWELEPIEQDGRFVYGSWQLRGRKIGGLLPMGDGFPPQMPAVWVAYFGVESVDATRARAQELGGDVRVERMEVPSGAFSVLADPHGAVFAVSEGTFDPPPPG
jgi:predicted enzyme related to lactoylglutathione lyase